jgi:hypothetical protein
MTGIRTHKVFCFLPVALIHRDMDPATLRHPMDVFSSFCTFVWLLLCQTLWIVKKCVSLCTNNMNKDIQSKFHKTNLDTHG